MRHKFNIYNFTNKNSVFPQFTAVYHDNGYAVATDGRILVVSAADYKSEYNGTFVAGEGNTFNARAYNWRAAVQSGRNPDGETMPVSGADLLKTMTEREKALKSEGLRPAEVKTRVIIVKLGDDAIIAERLWRLKQFAIAAVHSGAECITWDGRALYAAGDTCSVMLMCSRVRGVTPQIEFI